MAFMDRAAGPPGGAAPSHPAFRADHSKDPAWGGISLMKPYLYFRVKPGIQRRSRPGLAILLVFLGLAVSVQDSSAQAMRFSLDIPPGVFSPVEEPGTTATVSLPSVKDPLVNPAAANPSKGKKKTTPTPTSLPVSQYTPTATLTPSPVPTATGTSTPPPSPTPTSTATPTVTAAPTETPAPTSTPTTTPTPERDDNSSRAAWVWNEEEILVSEAAVQEFHDTCVRYQIRKVYFSTNEALLNTPAMLEFLPGMIAKLRSSGIETTALVSSIRWFYPEYRYQLMNWIERVAALNRSHAEEARFTGLHLDIEPEAQPEWATAPLDTRAAWLQMLADMYGEARRKIQAESMEVALEADVGPYHMKYNAAAVDQLAGSIDQITIMAYVKATPDAILEYAGPVIDLARAHQIRYSIGARTNDYLTAVDMNAVLGEITRRLRDDPIADGASIHHYKNYIAFNEFVGPSITMD